MDPSPEILARRAKRQERRERQRAQNLGRALKMRAARLTFEKTAESNPLSEPPALNVGCSGWFYWHWRDRFYHQSLPTSRWFDHYARHFHTVELNAPFYSWPTVAAVNAWTRQAGRKRFIYTVKACELITHVRRFVGTKTLVRDFSFISDLLGPRLGCFLFQLPPSFHYSPARLMRILDQLDPRLRNVVEFRHRSWWNRDVYSAFTNAGVIFCSCSGPRLPDELIRTADDIYIRFHGATHWYRHDYSTEELEIWAQRIRSCGAKRVWAYFNNDRDCHAIKNAKALLRRLR